jgi:hypothetical protein
MKITALDHRTKDLLWRNLYYFFELHSDKFNAFFFGHFFRKYFYKPLASCNELILEMIDEKILLFIQAAGNVIRSIHF